MWGGFMKFLRLSSVVISASILLLLLACSESITNKSGNNSSIDTARWDAGNQILSISGKSTVKNLSIVSAKRKNLIADVNVSADKNWSIQLAKPNVVPCSIQFGSNNQSEKKVINAPSNCGVSTSKSVKVAVRNNFTIQSILPQGTIITPIGDVKIKSGDTVDFSALASTTGVRFNWDFADAAKSTSIQNPGKVKFIKPGVYRVKLTVVNSDGISDITPDERTITVLPIANQTRSAHPAPVVSIVSPILPENLINVGDQLLFAALNRTPDQRLDYLWDFGGAAENSTRQVPGWITFLKAGTYDISLVVTNSDGVSSIEPEVISVTVSGESGINQAPTGMIISPLSDQTLILGQSIAFEGAALDPNDNQPFTYKWEFDGAAEDSTDLNPGEVLFSQLGTFNVKFIVTDSLGQADTNPPMVTINVIDNATSNNDLPIASIIKPVATMSILMGESVEFEGAGESPTGNLPLTYIWNFDGAAPDSTIDIPGPIVFPDAGIFSVTLMVVDSLGQISESPAEVTILVDVPDSPNATILTPENNIHILPGDSLDFTSEAVSPIDALPISYLWDFGGLMPESIEQNPGIITFDTPGNYIFTLTVTDANGVIDATPATVIVNVDDPAATPPTPDPTPTPAPTDLPDGIITSPEETISILVGESVDFVGEGVSATGNLPLEYLWNFDGAAPDVNVDIPGPVLFEEAGIYNITLTVTDSLGQTDDTPAEVLVLVDIPDAPDGAILSPESHIHILPGESLAFIGEGASPIGADPLTYFWDFGPIAPVSNEQNPGLITFETPGDYIFTFTVTDANGLSDATPASVMIHVDEPTATPAPDPAPTPDPANPDGPNGEITSPIGDQVINVGDRIDFHGAGNSPLGLALTYLWTFDGAAPDFVGAFPEFVVFNTPGAFEVTLTVVDESGVADPDPAKVIIMVIDPNATPEPPPVDPGPPGAPNEPNGRITSPSDDITVTVGDAVEFTGRGNVRGGVEPLEYLWTFSGAAPESPDQNPGVVIFEAEGVYEIVFTVSDAAGVADSTPDSIMVTVVAAAAPPPAEPPPTAPLGAPVGIILSPDPASSPITIAAGDSIEFLGGVDGGAEDINFLWTFNGAVPSANVQDPGVVVFDTPGEFVVTLTVINDAGMADPNPPQIEVIVEAVIP